MTSKLQDHKLVSLIRNHPVTAIASRILRIPEPEVNSLAQLAADYLSETGDNPELESEAYELLAEPVVAVQLLGLEAEQMEMDWRENPEQAILESLGHLERQLSEMMASNPENPRKEAGRLLADNLELNLNSQK